MTTYRQIGDDEVQVDAPCTQQLFNALKDNPDAYQEGDSSVPARISYKACRLRTQPSVGDVVVAQVSSHTTVTDTSTVAIEIRTRGVFRIRLHCRLGSAAGATFSAGNLDGNEDTTQAKLQIKLLSGGETTDLGSEITVNQHGKNNETVEQLFEVSDYIFVSITETLENIEASLTLTVSCSDTNTIYGCDAIPRIT